MTYLTLKEFQDQTTDWIRETLPLQEGRRVSERDLDRFAAAYAVVVGNILLYAQEHDLTGEQLLGELERYLQQ